MAKYKKGDLLVNNKFNYGAHLIILNTFPKRYSIMWFHESSEGYHEYFYISAIDSTLELYSDIFRDEI